MVVKAKEYVFIFNKMVGRGLSPERAREVAGGHKKPIKQKRIQKEIYCDAPDCGKDMKFQCGKNKYGKIGSWCCDQHFNRFVK